MRNRLCCCLVLAVMTTESAGAQQSPSFEVASIKPSPSQPGPLRNVLWLPGGRMTATGLTLRELVRSAYVGDGIQLLTQIVGGPSWVDTDRFDIVAKAGDMSAQNADEVNRQRRAMLKSLLAERFALRVHLDSRPLPVFDLVPAGGDGRPGPQLKVSTCNRNAAPPNSQISVDARPCMPFRLVGMNPATGITMGAEGVTMPEFAAALAGFPEIGRQIRDRTGLTGAFDMKLTLAMPIPPGVALVGGSTSPANSDIGILAALQEQLGLKLEGRIDHAEVVVIDSVERPTAN